MTTTITTCAGRSPYGIDFCRLGNLGDLRLASFHKICFTHARSSLHLCMYVNACGPSDSFIHDRGVEPAKRLVPLSHHGGSRRFPQKPARLRLLRCFWQEEESLIHTFKYEGRRTPPPPLSGPQHGQKRLVDQEPRWQIDFGHQ